MIALNRRQLLGAGGLGVAFLLAGGSAEADDEHRVGDAATTDSDGGASQKEVEEAVNESFGGGPESPAEIPIPAELAELRREICATIDDRLEQSAWVEPKLAEEQPEAASARVELGEMWLSGQHRIHRHGPSLEVETRQHKKKVWVDISHPMIEDFAHDAIACAIGAATASVIAAAVSNPAGGLALFLPAWKACMYAKVSAPVVNDTSVQIGTADHASCWSNHC